MTCACAHMCPRHLCRHFDSALQGAEARLPVSVFSQWERVMGAADKDKEVVCAICMVEADENEKVRDRQRTPRRACLVHAKVRVLKGFLSAVVCLQSQ